MEINKMHQTGTVPLLVFLVGCAPNATPCTAEREKSWNKQRFSLFVISLLCLCCVSVFYFFCFCFFSHGYLSHPLRLRRGGVLSEPKCPSVCSGKYSLGIKPKPQASTPWNNSLCHSSEICHYNLLNFKTDWQGDKSSGPDATCLFWVMKSRLWRGLWLFNQSSEWFCVVLSAHWGSLHRGANPGRLLTVEGNESSHKLPFRHFGALGLWHWPRTHPAHWQTQNKLIHKVEHLSTEKYAGKCDEISNKVEQAK